MANPFQHVEVGRVGKSVFNLSYNKQMSGIMGSIYPIYIQKVVPGDVTQYGNEIVCRFVNPLVAPMFTPVTVECFYFFGNYRTMAEKAGNGFDFEAYITGGLDGADAQTFPTWSPTDVAVGSLWDHMEMPTTVTPDADNRPDAFLQYLYNWIWNEYFRDQVIDTELVIDTAEAIQNARWPKDYFTAARPSQQLGSPGALALSGTTNATWGAFSGSNNTPLDYDDVAMVPGSANDKTLLESNTVDFSGAGTFDLEDLRVLVAEQKFQEKNSRAGARYIEYLRAHFGVSEGDGDERLQRPVYLGGTKTQIITSEVVGTNQDTDGDPIGTLAGHGIGVSKNFAFKYRAKEFGIIMGVMVVRPEPSYNTQGIDRDWQQYTRYDWYNPLFSGLSEQPIYRRELYLNNNKANNETVFGYIGRFDQMRVRMNKTAGLMRTDFDHYNMARQFGAAPTLNVAFLNMDGDGTGTPNVRTDAFAAPTQDTVFVNIGNLVRAIRPLPILGIPGGL